MLKEVMIKCNVVLIVTLMLIGINGVSQAAFNPEVTVTAGKQTTAQSVRFSSGVIRDGMQISYEDLATKPYLWCIEHGVFLPSRLSATRPERDATLEINGTQRYIPELNSTNQELGKTRGDANSVNPYGPQGTKVGTVFTPGKFTSAGEKEATVSEAFIAAHDNLYPKSTDNYPNPIQTAIWANQSGGTGVTTAEDLNTSLSNAANGGREIQKSAELLEQAVKKTDEFAQNHAGATVVNITDYGKLKIAYNKNKGTTIVGPFNVDYVWSMYKPKGEINSKVLNEAGAFEFSAIKQIQIYGNDNMTKELKNYKFLYPGRDATKQEIVKASEAGGIEYRYPMPKEDFYIEFLDSEYKDMAGLARLKITTGRMMAEGAYEVLTGTSQQIDYKSKEEKIECTSTRPVKNTNMCALHQPHQIGDGHARSFIYSVEGTIIAEIDVQKTKVDLRATIYRQPTTVTTELGYPAPAMPFMFPVIWGNPRGNETQYVPYLPYDPDPNQPINPPTPDPDPDPDPEIKLTFDIAGTVWLDEFLGKETLANGIKDPIERGLQNIIVRLYKVGEDRPVRETLTNENGQYMFQYVRIGYDYYVEFTYDGMTYTNTKYLGSLLSTNVVGEAEALNAEYRRNPEKFQNTSHAVESMVDRLAFNSKFLEISNNQAMGSTGIIPLTYRTYMAEQGAVSALITTDSNYLPLPEFQMTSSTQTAGLYYLLDDNYVASTEDLNLTQLGEDYYYHATYPGTLHINLGLVKRDRGDFAVKNDVYQTILTMKENIQTYKSNGKTTDALTYDAQSRDGKYYTDKVFTQKIDRADYNWRFDSSYAEYANVVKNAIDVTDELNAYVEYKYLIRNQSPALTNIGSVLELTNHFDSTLEYLDKYDFTDLTSWIETNMVDEDGEVYRERVEWEVGSTYNGYTTMKTDSIKDKILTSGETIELHVIFKVKKDGNRNILMDLGDGDIKENVIEVSKYTFYQEGLIDRDSNPGNVVLDKFDTFEDDTDGAPFVKLVFNDYPENNGEGKVVTGYVWEDLADKIMTNNLYTGNGIKDGKEKGIPNVKVELIEVLMDKSTGNELEILRKVGDTYSFRTDKNGQYKFTNLPTGTYKVKFTYGDQTQLKSNIKYNGQDYKSVSTDTLTQQYQRPGMEVMVLADTSESMSINGKAKIVSESAKSLIEKLYDKVQTVKVGAVLFSEPQTGGTSVAALKTKPEKKSVLSLFDNVKQNTGASLESAIDNALTQYTSTAPTKVMVICTDGYISSNANAALHRAAAAGVKVISVVCSTDEWTINTFGTESNPTTGILYYVRDVNIAEYMTEVAYEDVLQEISKVLGNTTYAKDVQKIYSASVDSVVGEIYTRQKNIDYTTSMKYENASVVDGKDTTNLTEFANKTQMTAITPIKNVMISHNNAETADTNLGLIERPKVELQIREEISGIQVKLSNGDVIIDTTKDLTHNVQIIPNAKYNIFLDDEIIQGSTLSVEYRITVFNNGHVDTLGEYFDYDMYNSAEVARYTATVATRVGTIYSYYTNLTFRPTDNTNLPIERNQVVTDAKTSGRTLTNWQSYIKSDGVHTPAVKSVNVMLTQDGQAQVMTQKAKWEAKNLVKTGVEGDIRLKDGSVKSVQTNSLNNIMLYPVTSPEVLSGKQDASVSTYIKFSKTISANDITDTLNYKQSVEIVERLNELGRRDYIGVPGNYSPHADITEYDSAKVAEIIVLNPFGGDMRTYYGLAAGLVAILGVGVVFIRKKIVK